MLTNACLLTRTAACFFEFTRHQSNCLQSSVVLMQRFILSSLLHSIAMNTVRSRPFRQLTLEEKLEVKRLEV